VSRVIEREEAELEAFLRRDPDHLTLHDMKRGLLVSFEHRGERRVGKVAACGRVGARVLSGWWVKDNEPDPTRRRSPMEYLVPYTSLMAAAWAGSTVATRHGYTLYVQRVHGREVEGIVTTEGDIAYGLPGSIPATEIIAVHDGGTTWGAA
jgi:hypothetical protein